MSAEQYYDLCEDVQKTVYQLIISQLWFDSYDDIASEIEVCHNLFNVCPSNQLYEIIKSCQISAKFHQTVSQACTLNGPPLEVLRHPKVDDYFNDDLVTIHPGPLSAEVVIPKQTDQNNHNSFLSGRIKHGQHVVEKPNVDIETCLSTKSGAGNINLNNIQHPEKLIVFNPRNQDVEDCANKSCPMSSNVTTNMGNLIVQSLNTVAFALSDNNCNTLSSDNNCNKDCDEFNNAIKPKTVKVVPTTAAAKSFTKTPSHPNITKSPLQPIPKIPSQLSTKTPSQPSNKKPLCFTEKQEGCSVILKPVIPPEAPVTSGMSHQDVFSKMLNNTKVSIDELNAYVDRTIPVEERTKSTFIYDLITAVCRSSLLVGNNVILFSYVSMKEYSPILMKYLQSGKDNLQVELDALNAVQLLVHELQHPRNLAYSIFCALDDAEVITPKGFKYWHNNSSEQLGRGVIRSGLRAFFTELSDDSDT